MRNFKDKLMKGLKAGSRRCFLHQGAASRVADPDRSRNEPVYRGTEKFGGYLAELFTTGRSVDARVSCTSCDIRLIFILCYEKSLQLPSSLLSLSIFQKYLKRRVVEKIVESERIREKDELR